MSLPTAIRCPFTLALFVCVAAGGVASARADDSALLSSLAEAHPRLFVQPGDWERLRTRIDSNERLSKWRDELHRDAEGMLDDPLPKRIIPDGKRLLRMSRRVLGNVSTLALLYRLDGDDRYRERAWKELEAAAGFKDWNPSHFLDVGEMTLAFAIGYDWLYADLTERQREVIRGAILKHGLEPGLKSYRTKSGYGWWVRADHNWNQVCNGGLIAGALAVGDEEPEIAEEILRGALASLPRAMESYGQDGGYLEGPGYWVYGTSYNVFAIAALRSALGRDFDLPDAEAFDVTGDFPLQLTGPLGRTFNFADASGSAGPPQAAALHWLAVEFERPAYARFQAALVDERGPSPFDLLWHRPEAASGDSRLPLGGRFRDVAVVTLRSAWDDPQAAYVAFKGGSPRHNHAQADLGSFIYDSKGQRWVVDLGKDNYNLPGYFDRGRRRWTFYRNRAEGHNTLVIGPGQVADQVVAANAPIAGFSIDDPDFRFGRVDLTAAYQPAAKSAQRGIALVDGDHLLIRDELQLRSATSVRWHLHTLAEVKLTADGRRAALRLGEQTLWARIDQPAEARFRVENAAALPDSPTIAGQAENPGVRRLAIPLGEVDAATIVVVLGSTPEVAVPDRPLAEWK